MFPELINMDNISGGLSSWQRCMVDNVWSYILSSYKIQSCVIKGIMSLFTLKRVLNMNVNGGNV